MFLKISCILKLCFNTNLANVKIVLQHFIFMNLQSYLNLFWILEVMFIILGACYLPDTLVKFEGSATLNTGNFCNVWTELVGVTGVPRSFTEFSVFQRVPKSFRCYKIRKTAFNAISSCKINFVNLSGVTKTFVALPKLQCAKKLHTFFITWA